MEEKVNVAKIGLEPESVMDNRQRMIIANYVHTEGFVILQRIMEDEIKRLNRKLVNTDHSNTDEVLSNHALVKAAGMFYEGVLQRIKGEITIVNSETSTIGSISDPERPYYPPEFEGQELF